MTFRRRMAFPHQGAGVGLGKEYQEIQMGDTRYISSKEGPDGKTPAGGTAGICRQHGSIGNQTVCQPPPTVSFPQVLSHWEGPI